MTTQPNMHGLLLIFIIAPMTALVKYKFPAVAFAINKMGGSVVRKLLIVKPVLNNYRDRTRTYFEVVSHSFSMLLKDERMEPSYEIIELDEYNATRDGLELILARNPDITDVVFLTHGRTDGGCALGQGMEPCIDEYNVGCLSGKGGYFVCCHAGSSLGVAAVNAGALYFIGFRNKVYLGERKLEWIVATTLLYGLRQILTGRDPLDAWEMMQQEHGYWITELLERSDRTKDIEWLLGACVLDYNREQLMLRTQSERREGVSLLRNPTSVKDLTHEEFERAMAALRQWVQDPKSLPLSKIGTAGTAVQDDLSPARVLEIIKERRRQGTLGVGDPPEMLLVQLAKKE